MRKWHETYCRIPKTNEWLGRYRIWLASGLTLIFYSQLDQYLYGAFGVIPPLFWLATSGALAAPLAARYISQLEVPVPQLVAVAGGYALLLTWGWLRSNSGPVTQQALETGLLSVLVMLLFANLLATPQAVRAARYAVVTVVIVSVAVIVYEVLSTAHHMNAVSPWSPKDICRAAGFYVNPNGAAISMLFGCVLALPVIAERWRPVFLVWIATGVMLTFSRAGFLVLGLTLGVIGWQRQVPPKRLIIAMGVLVILTVAFFTVAVRTSTKASMCLNRYVSQPGVRWLADVGSAGLRIRLLQIAWREAEGSHYLGAGLGAMAAATADAIGRATGAHNMYFQLFAEMGVPGLLFLPAILWLLVLSGRSGERETTVAFAWVFGTWGMFDHNVLDTYSKLLALSLMFAINAASKGGEIARLDRICRDFANVVSTRIWTGRR